ncbi:alpha/beta fold hydrolase [Mycobacteroides salmoniphilum]|uniref:alpha/beta fold hydrolase n=1 Tax=Mycobacteroides salmoniphilum TaxID=404941 RepID=UPI0009942EB0|nr:alpha/beta fold hydrolase [Mycobacteroides salmoniphilum]QCH24274.1 Pyrethroid hydrolase [Mycobacteroides salmoniphilum]
MTTYVLVHGAFHGGWCWDRLTPILEAAGHEVYAPSLTGLGDRAAELGPEVGLDAHVSDIAGLIADEDLTDVVLVGHSYAGIVITAVADQIPSRIALLVYLDTFVAHDGEAVADILPVNVQAFADAAQAEGDGWRVPVAGMPPGVEGCYGVTDEPDLSWLRSMQSPQSLRTFTDVLRLGNPAQRQSVPRAHIHCSGGGEAWTSLRKQLMPRSYPPAGEPMRELETGHDAMITKPDELAAVLDDLVTAHARSGSTHALR